MILVYFMPVFGLLFVAKGGGMIARAQPNPLEYAPRIVEFVGLPRSFEMKPLKIHVKQSWMEYQ